MQQFRDAARLSTLRRCFSPRAGDSRFLLKRHAPSALRVADEAPLRFRLFRTFLSLLRKRESAFRSRWRAPIRPTREPTNLTAVRAFHAA